MPRSAQYTLSWLPERAAYVLIGPDTNEHTTLSVAWLAEHRAFAFHGRQGQVNLLKEKRSRGGEGYWYAYRRHEGKMSKRYLGRDEQISPERLEEVAAWLKGETTLETESVGASSETGQDRSGNTSLAFSDATGSDSAFLLATTSLLLPEEDKQAAALSFEPLLLSKLQLPRAQKALLPREHLLAMLDEGLERKVIVLDAPAGYGKTTLIGQWLATRAQRPDFPRVASVLLDANDNDPIRFWRYLIAACQAFAPGVGQEALDLLRTYRLPPLQFKPLELPLVSLLNELGQRAEPGILILDDLHVIQAPQVLASLSFFLEHLPLSLHLVLIMRGDPPFSLTRLRAQNDLLDFPPASLHFSLEETREFFARELPLTLSPRIVHELHQRLEGWPAGLRLFSSLLSRSGGEQEIEQLLAGFAGSHWSLRAYFLDEVLHRLPEAHQEFLLLSSILPRVTAQLCDALLERNDSAAVIEALRSGDFFLIPLDSQGEWLRYQTLFAETMQQEARRRLGDARLDRLASEASYWYEAHGLLAESIDTALNAAEFARASTLITRFIAEKYQNNTFIFLEIYHLKRWLESLPTDELERHPLFCLHYAMILLFVHAERARLQQERERVYHLLQVAEQRWRDANDTPDLGAVFAFRALLARQEGRTLQALTWARQALAWLSPRDLIWRTIALTVMGVGAIMVGTLAEAREALQEARMLNERLGNAMYARAALGMLTWVHLEQGELSYAAEQFRQMQAEARAQEDRDDIARTQLGLSHILYQWDRLDEAEEAVHEAQMLGAQMNEDELLSIAAQRLAKIQHARGQSEQAQQRLTAWLARHSVPISPQDYQAYREAQALLASIQLACGDLIAVERWYASLEQRAEIIPLYQRQREQLLSARLFLAQGKDAAALELVEQLLEAAQQSGHRAFALEIQVVRILLYARQGQHNRVRETLSLVLAIARSEGYLRLFLDEGSAMADLLRKLLPHLHEKALVLYVQSILARFGDNVQERPIGEVPAQHGLPEPLSAREQKVLRLLVAGQANAEIARELVVSVNTVRSQVQSIYRKLGVNNRMQASAAARQLQLLDVPHSS